MKLTMLQHCMIGNSILLFVWHAWISKYFYNEKNRKDIQDEIDYWMS